MGCSQSPVHVPSNDRNRTEILKLLLTCFSETIYMTPSGNSLSRWFRQGALLTLLWVFSSPFSWTSCSTQQMVSVFYFRSKSVTLSFTLSNKTTASPFPFPRQTLPLFTSLINIVFSYDPVGYLPYNYLLFTDSREPLVEVAAQLLCITLDNSSFSSTDVPSSPTSTSAPSNAVDDSPNLFINYLSRIHRDDVRPMGVAVLLSSVSLLLL